MPVISDNTYLLDDEAEMDKFLTFCLGEDVYGINIKHVTEIIGMQHITAFPEVPEYVKGVINLRGRIIPVIDLALKFHGQRTSCSLRTCIIITEIGGISAGLIVDDVKEVIEIAPEDITMPPNYKKMLYKRYIEGIAKNEGGVKILIDCSKLLREDEIEELRQIEA